MCQTGLWVVKSAVWYRPDLSAEVYEPETRADVTNSNEDAAAQRLKAQSSAFPRLAQPHCKIFTAKLVFYLWKEIGTTKKAPFCVPWVPEGSDPMSSFLRSPLLFCFPFRCDSVITEQPIYIWRDAHLLICHSSRSLTCSPEPAEPNSAQLTVTTWQCNNHCRFNS